MSDMFGDVKKFIEACDQEKNFDNAMLYDSLITEEYEEFKEADNRTEDLDACMDMIWVILGYCYMREYDVVGGWNEVARSNLAKINPATGKVIKREDGKVLKPEGWTPPSLEQFTQ
jgi:predicted HAD superfamily Cof-like phosphohydrolase